MTPPLSSGVSRLMTSFQTLSFSRVIYAPPVGQRGLDIREGDVLILPLAHRRGSTCHQASIPEPGQYFAQGRVSFVGHEAASLPLSEVDSKRFERAQASSSAVSLTTRLRGYFEVGGPSSKSSQFFQGRFGKPDAGCCFLRPEIHGNLAGNITRVLTTWVEYSGTEIFCRKQLHSHSKPARFQRPIGLELPRTDWHLSSAWQVSASTSKRAPSSFIAARSSPCATRGLVPASSCRAAERYAPGRGTSPTACLGTPRAPPKWEQGKAIGNIILLAAGLEQG